jgi:predicted RNA-binding Zn ribbon-like protein
MSTAQRELLRLGSDLAVDFANTVQAPAAPAGSLRSWSDLVEFLEVRGAVTAGEGARLRAMGERDARRCAAALDEVLRLRETIRSMLDALVARRALRAGWIAHLNEALGWGAGAARLARDGARWRLEPVPALADPRRALAPVARSMASLAAEGAGAEIRRCANPRCVLYFRDRSRSRRRRWCSMAVCGNRMKVAAHLRRHGRRRSA